MVAITPMRPYHPNLPSDGSARRRAAPGPVGKDPRFARQDKTTGPRAALLLELALTRLFPTQVLERASGFGRQETRTTEAYPLWSGEGGRAFLRQNDARDSVPGSEIGGLSGFQRLISEMRPV